MVDDLRNKYDVDAPRCRGAYLEDAPRRIWTEPDWFLEEKLDGVRLTVQIDKNGALLVGRNRQDFLKGVARAREFRCLNELNPRLSRIGCKELAGTVLDGELTEVMTKNGQYDRMTNERLRNGDFVGYTTWGVLFWMGEDVRSWTERERWECARKAVEVLNKRWVRLIERLPAKPKFLKRMLNTGIEGVVAKHWSAPIPIGQRTNTHWFKIKGDSRRTVDAFVIGVTEGASGGSGVKDVKPKLDGTAASFTMGMYRDGKIVEVGKLKNLPGPCWLHGLKQFDKFKHVVVEMRISGWNGKAFRWPKWVRLRTDKTPIDCQFDEQVGDGRRQKRP